MQNWREQHQEVSLEAKGHYFWEWNIDQQVFSITHPGTDFAEVSNHKDSSIAEWHNCIHPDDKVSTIKSFSLSLNDDRINHWEREYRLLLKDDNYILVADKAIILRDKLGKAIKIIGALQNIDEKKVNNIILNESIRRYKNITSGSTTILWDWDLQTGDIVWSDNYAQLLGWQLSAGNKSTDKEFFSKIHPEDYPEVNASLQQTIQNSDQSQWQVEYRFQKADGSYAYVNDHGFIVRDENGKPQRMLGAIQDNTENWYQAKFLELEKNAFESFSSLKTSFADIIQTFLVGVEKLIPFMHTSVLSITENETLECLYTGRLPEALIIAIEGTKANPDDGCWGTALYKKETSIIADVNFDPISKEYRQLLADSGFVSCWSFPLINRSGIAKVCLTFMLKESGTPGKKDVGLSEKVRNTLQILMQNDQLLKEIKWTNKRFDVLMKATNDLIWDWDLMNGTVYRDVEGVHKVYGINDETIINDIDEWIKRIHPDDRVKMQKTIRRILTTQNERAFELEYRFLREDGTYAFVNDRGILLLNSEGKPYRMIGAAHDITERKQLEKELIDKELEKQKAINQATIDTQEQERTEIGKELHDNVNQVLTTTKLYLELAASNPEMKDQLIEKSTKNIIYVINEIRQLSRSLMNPSLGDLGLIEALRDLAENIHFTKKLHLNLELDEEIDSILDENKKVMLFRISQEILNNTIKHAQATTVDIELSKVENHVELIIRDDGKGFDILKVKKGAGLKNIQNRVYLAGGTLDIQSNPGKGSTTVVKCPVKNYE